MTQGTQTEAVRPQSVINKLCSDCRQDRPIGKFIPSRHHADGFTDRCLDCIKVAAQRDRKAREERANG